VQSIAPRGLTTAMTGLFSGANNVGGLLGSIIGGIVYDEFGGRALFAGLSLINFTLGFALVAAKLREDHPRRPPAYVRLSTGVPVVELELRDL
jgi:predicted MFS family arabinose efflux permease